MGVFVLLTFVFALGTAVLGWWCLPLIALAWGALAPRPWVSWKLVGVAAGCSWMALLIWTATQGPIGQVARKVGAIMGFPGPLLFLFTVLFAVMLAASAAVLGELLRRRA